MERNVLLQPIHFRGILLGIEVVRQADNHPEKPDSRLVKKFGLRGILILQILEHFMKLIFESDAIKNDLIFDRVFVNDLFRQRATNIEENFNPRIIRGGTVVMLGFCRSSQIFPAEAS